MSSSRSPLKQYVLVCCYYCNLLDSVQTFAPHARRLSVNSFYHLHQMNTMCKSLTEDAATITMHALVNSKVDYCNSVLHCVTAANVQPLQNVLSATARIILRSSTTSPPTFEIDYIGCPFNSIENTKCVSWCTSVCIRLRQHTTLKLNWAYQCLNQPIVVMSILLHGTNLVELTPIEFDNL